MFRLPALRTSAFAIAALTVALTGAFAEHRRITQEDLDYPGTIVIADGHGKVDVRVFYQAQEDCWKIKLARQGLPNPETDRPTDRHLYITVMIEKTVETCASKLTELQTRIMIDDKPGTISLDVMFVDARGVYQRSQRHRIQRECTGEGAKSAC
jgi:hypothetical protein